MSTAQPRHPRIRGIAEGSALFRYLLTKRLLNYVLINGSAEGNSFCRYLLTERLLNYILINGSAEGNALCREREGAPRILFIFRAEGPRIELEDWETHHVART